MHLIALQLIALQLGALQLVTLQLTALQLIALHLIALHLIPLHRIALHLIALHLTPLQVMHLMHRSPAHCSAANAYHASFSSWLPRREGHSVFFTGCAGTGKSLLLKHILRTLPKDTTFVTASTGLAASALGGTTINAFAGERLSLLCHCACPEHQPCLSADFHWGMFCPSYSTSPAFLIASIGHVLPFTQQQPCLSDKLHWGMFCPACSSSPASPDHLSLGMMPLSLDALPSMPLAGQCVSLRLH